MIFGLACAFAALAYAELAASVGSCSSAYGYSYAAFGEFVAWIIVSCGGLMAFLPAMTWMRFSVWLTIGIIVYFTYSIRHSKLSKTKERNKKAGLRRLFY